MTNRRGKKGPIHRLFALNMDRKRCPQLKQRCLPKRAIHVVTQIVRIERGNESFDVAYNCSNRKTKTNTLRSKSIPKTATLMSTRVGPIRLRMSELLHSGQWSILCAIDVC